MENGDAEGAVGRLSEAAPGAVAPGVLRSAPPCCFHGRTEFRPQMTRRSER